MEYEWHREVKAWFSSQIERVNKLAPSLSKLFQARVSGKPRCLSCDSFLEEQELVKDGKDVILNFCSIECYRVNLRKFRTYNHKTNGVWICSLESCEKECYVEQDGHIYDYCSKSHAKLHKERFDLLSARQNKYNLRRHHSKQRKVPSPVLYQDPNAPILFYDRQDPYYEFTNFAIDFGIEINGVTYPTTEHFFQSQKLIGTPHVARLLALERPREAFEYPRQPHVAVWVRKDWSQVKDKIMYLALLAKFSQHEYLRDLLLNTGNRHLVEHSPYDNYWGDGPDGKGLNKLGQLLMEVRGVLRKIIDPVKQQSQLNQSDQVKQDEQVHQNEPVKQNHQVYQNEPVKQNNQVDQNELVKRGGQESKPTTEFDQDSENLIRFDNEDHMPKPTVTEPTSKGYKSDDGTQVHQCLIDSDNPITEDNLLFPDQILVNTDDNLPAINQPPAVGVKCNNAEQSNVDPARKNDQQTKNLFYVGNNSTKQHVEVQPNTDTNIPSNAEPMEVESSSNEEEDNMDTS